MIYIHKMRKGFVNIQLRQCKFIYHYVSSRRSWFYHEWHWNNIIGKPKLFYLCVIVTYEMVGKLVFNCESVYQCKWKAAIEWKLSTGTAMMQSQEYMYHKGYHLNSTKSCKIVCFVDLGLQCENNLYFITHIASTNILKTIIFLSRFGLI